mmetsp:Transcript_18946/g.53437  ORF Transcript_18946/g.53437 Transcript_18946/m.53437 type:complete len:159 (-) Transcript_18946:83-559(-)
MAASAVARAPRELMPAEDAEGFERMLEALDDPHFRATIRAFVHDHCEAFAEAAELDASGTGHPLAWTELHGGYRALFDAQLEGFLAGEGVPREAFLKLARRLSKASAPWRAGWEAFLAEVTASEDYGAFVAAMREAGVRLRATKVEAARTVELQTLSA